MKHASTTLESIQQSAEWTAGKSHPKWPKLQKSAGKVLASVFWDAQGILFIDYLEKGRTIHSKYYIALVACLKEEITKKQPQMKKKKVLFHQDNVPYHKSISSMAKLYELHFELLLNPPYSQDLTLSDYWLFANLKRMLQGKRWRSDIKNWGIFWGPKQIVLQKRHRIVTEALESVHHPKRKLLMNKVKFCLKVVVLLVRPKTYWVMC